MQTLDKNVLATVGKVIAVHINYPSRAAQRGRTPKLPSYFLKPASSLNGSGTVERPLGCELLGFEGEIALIIGTTARRVCPAEAWQHVQWVTASNDLGIYDLRYADKGSNLRSKGGDGFTPIGPGLLPAADVDPTQLRIQTWLNSELVQDDSTETLLFPFSQLIADLSQLITLEPGDVILTGTPAGASVAVPGDVVEIDVSAGDLSTGKLRTEVTEGITPLAEYGAQPRVDDVQRAEAWGTPAPEPETTLTPELKAKLNRIATATLSSQLRKRGFNNVSIDGLSATRPGEKVVGTARTLRYIPNREDLFKEFGGGYNAQKRAIDTLKDGDVLVMEARGEKGTGTLGDILALRAMYNGAAAIISDGGVRDYTAVAELELPVYAANPHPAVLGRKHVPWAVDETIGCGGAAVQPGDIIVADDDGILVIPPALAAELADDSLQQEHEETFIAQMVREGHGVDGLYPMNSAWQEKYAVWARQNPLQP